MSTKRDAICVDGPAGLIYHSECRYDILDGHLWISNRLGPVEMVYAPGHWYKVWPSTEELEPS